MHYARDDLPMMRAWGVNFRYVEPDADRIPALASTLMGRRLV
jgi:hypothetical protein